MPVLWVENSQASKNDALRSLLTGGSRHPQLVSIVIALRDKLQEIYGDRLAKLILFGSQARGDARVNSDLDLLIVLRDRSAKIDRLQEQERTQFITNLCLDYEVVICPIFWLEDQLDWEHYPLLRNIKTDGINLLNDQRNWRSTPESPRQSKGGKVVIS